MNIYDRRTEAFKNYTPLPEAEKAWKKGMKTAGILLVGLVLAAGCLIVSPNFFLSYRGEWFLTLFIIVLSIFAVPVFNFQSRFLTDMKLHHDFIFMSYKTASSRLASKALLTIASLNILMCNAENAEFAYELIDISRLKPKYMPAYEKVKAYVENSDVRADEAYNVESLIPRWYRRMKSSRLIAIFIVICDILMIAGLVYVSIIYLLIHIEGI